MYNNNEDLALMSRLEVNMDNEQKELWKVLGGCDGLTIGQGEIIQSLINSWIKLRVDGLKTTIIVGDMADEHDLRKEAKIRNQTLKDVLSALGIDEGLSDESYCHISSNR